MSNIIGMSGSTILSNREQFNDLFSYGIDHIEIGEFENIDDMEYMLSEMDKRNITYGIHSPIIRNTSKYDLVERVHYSPQYAMCQFQSEAKMLAKTNAKYHLVHFPYFENESDKCQIDVMEDRLEQLACIRDKYGIEIVCEPKLNGYMSPYTIEMMDKFPVDLWAKYNLKICIDIGDYLLAVDKQMEKYIYKWMDYIRVVHLHNVQFDDIRYRWIPIHHKYQQSVDYNIGNIIKNIAKKNDIYYIIEHTPHIEHSKEYTLEGIDWVRELVK